MGGNTLSSAEPSQIILGQAPYFVVTTTGSVLTVC
jgi:hypothetical protein